MDYGAYRKFSQFVTLDIKEYIDLMAAESDKVPAKDAALVISWDDVLKRAVNQEKFLADYPDSKKLEDVRLLYCEDAKRGQFSFDTQKAFKRRLFSFDL